MAKWVILNEKTGKYVGKFKKDTDTNPLYFNTSKAAFTELGKRNLGPQYKVTEREIGMKEFKHELNGVVFSVVWDEKTILETIQEERKGFIENHFVSTYSDEDDGCLSKEEYEENLDDMLQMFEVISSEDSLISLIEMAKKKKDGSFHKNRVTYIYQCENSVYITNWHNTWIYHALKVSPIDDYTLLLECLKITDTPG